MIPDAAAPNRMRRATSHRRVPSCSRAPAFIAARAFLLAWILILAWANPWTPGYAVEVSLEENKAERGNVGYVDMQRLFRLFPETKKAKQNFEDVLRQAEEQVNLRKSEIIGLRAEIARLRLERDFMAKSPLFSLPAQSPPPQSAAPAAPTPTVSVSTTAESSPSLSTAPEPTVSLSTPPMPAASAPTASPDSAAAPLLHLPGLAPSEAAGSQTVAAIPLALQDIDRTITERSKTLESKEGEFKTYRAQVEKNLLELESRRTEILLGKIYAAVQEVARDEGVSVVVDKSQILFGHKAVNLTEKVLGKLE